MFTSQSANVMSCQSWAVWNEIRGDVLAALGGGGVTWRVQVVDTAVPSQLLLWEL